MKKLLLTVLALTAVFCAAEEYPVLSVPEVKSTDCAVWRCMNRFNPLPGKETGKTGPEFARAPLWRAINHVAGAYPARVEINYTKDCLVIICSGQVKEVTVGRGDGPYAMFGGCTAEVFLQPDPAGPDFYQFAVSPDNRLYQAKGWDCTWKPAVPLKTAVISGREQGENGKNFWSARMEIPFAALGRGTPEKGETWKANFVFGKSWSPTTDYHDPSQFGTLVFSGREPGRVEVDEFTFRDGAFTLTFTNHGTTAAKVRNLNGSGEESELLPGKTAFRTAKFADHAHKDIHKFGVQVTQDGKTYRFSGLSPAKDPDNAGLKKFYYAPGELAEHPRPGEFRHGTATASVQPEEFFRPVPVPQGKLVLKDGHFEVGGVPYYPVVGAKNASVKIIGCIGSGFTREPVTGAVFDADLKITEHVFEQAEKKNEPTLFRIQYESQLTILQKDRAGKIQIVPDQIAFYEAAYRQ